MTEHIFVITQDGSLARFHVCLQSRVCLLDNLFVSREVFYAMNGTILNKIQTFDSQGIKDNDVIIAYNTNPSCDLIKRECNWIKKNQFENDDNLLMKMFAERTKSENMRIRDIRLRKTEVLRSRRRKLRMSEIIHDEIDFEAVSENSTISASDSCYPSTSPLPVLW